MINAVVTGTTTKAMVAGGVEVPVQVTRDGRGAEGTITLVNRRAWGKEPGHWVSQNILSLLSDLEPNDYRLALDELERVAAEAIGPQWSYEGYWNSVLGAHLDAEGVIREFELDPADRVGLDEWLGQAEAEVWRVGGEGDELPAEWADHHERALEELAAVTIAFGFEARTRDGQWSVEAAGEQDESNYFSVRSAAEEELPRLAEVLGCSLDEVRVVQVR